MANLHVVTPDTQPDHGLILCPGYICPCDSCTRDRHRAISLTRAGHRDKPQPWALERAA